MFALLLLRATNVWIAALAGSLPSKQFPIAYTNMNPVLLLKLTFALALAFTFVSTICALK
jgi:hypothetical protein